MIILILALMDALSTDVSIPAWAYLVLVIWWLIVTCFNVLIDL